MERQASGRSAYRRLSFGSFQAFRQTDTVQNKTENVRGGWENGGAEEIGRSYSPRGRVGPAGPDRLGPGPVWQEFKSIWTKCLRASRKRGFRVASCIGGALRTRCQNSAWCLRPEQPRCLAQGRAPRNAEGAASRAGPEQWLLLLTHRTLRACGPSVTGCFCSGCRQGKLESSLTVTRSAPDSWVCRVRLSVCVFTFACVYVRVPLYICVWVWLVCAGVAVSLSCAYTYLCASVCVQVTVLSL